MDGRTKMTYEIHEDRNGQPYLKRVNRFRNVSAEGRGMWAEIGRATDNAINRVIEANERAGYLVLPDDQGYFRILVLTD
jgi:hypothetical protein